MAYLFKVINLPSDDASVKNLLEYKESGNSVCFEDKSNIQNSQSFCPPNISFKQLLKLISPKNIVQIINCLIMEKKLILISKDIGINAMLIESLLELL